VDEVLKGLGVLMADAESRWYRQGLRFECTRCGACCTGAPGFVWVSSEEIAKLAEFRNESIDEFTRLYVRQVGHRYSLIEKPGGDCIFWDRERGCTVYPVRPTQCQTWPFWPENVASPESWERVKAVCPGSGRGQWFSVEQVEAAAARTRS
jgi:Fe-S-cluster containining protein